MGQARIGLELRFQKLWVVLLLEPLLVWKLNFTSNAHQDRLRFLVWLQKVMVCQTSPIDSNKLLLISHELTTDTILLSIIDNLPTQ